MTTEEKLFIEDQVHLFTPDGRLNPNYDAEVRFYHQKWLEKECTEDVLKMED